MSKIFRAIIVLFILSFLVSAGPPPKGSEVNLALGGGLYEYQTGGCGTVRTTHKGQEINGRVKVTHRSETGLSGSLGVESLGTKTTASLVRDREGRFVPAADSSEVGDLNTINRLTPTVGWHLKYGGGEVGPSVNFENDDSYILPSIDLWAGTSDIFFQAGLFPGPLTRNIELLRLGLGHQSEHLRVDGGLTVKVGDKVNIYVDALFPVSENISLGAILRKSVETKREVNAMGQISFNFAASE